MLVSIITVIAKMIITGMIRVIIIIVIIIIIITITIIIIIVMIIISTYKYISYKQLINNYIDNVRDIPAYGWFLVTVRKCCTYKLLLTTNATLLP